MRRLLILPFVLSALAGASSPAELELRIDRFRNAKGLAHLCLTRNPAYFPDCGDDPMALKRTVPVTRAGTVTVSGVAPGAYALSVIHDENANDRLDTWLGIPREGFGFSRNPKVSFGPPRFDQVRFELKGGITRQTVRMQYLL